MSHKPHDLASEFSQDHDVLHSLKMGNVRYAAVAAKYDEINREIFKIEAALEPASDQRAEGLKKQRLTLLDEIGAMIAAEKRAATA
jgi:Uncharacterized protein conserved in bacteria